MIPLRKKGTIFSIGVIVRITLMAVRIPTIRKIS
jgi:hypothetical protein